MGTPTTGGGFLNTVKNLLTQPMAGTPMAQRQSEQKIAEEQEQRAAELHDQQVHQFAMDHGWQVVGPGDTVHDSVPMHPVVMAMLNGTNGQSDQPPGSSSNMLDAEGNANPGATFNDGPPTSQSLMQAMMPAPAAGNVPMLRKAVPANVVKHTDSTGDVVKYEIPDPNTPGGQWRIMMAQRQAAMQTRQSAAATAQGTTEGQAAGTPQVPTTPDYNQQMGLPPGMTQIPVPAATNIAGKYIPANINANTREDIAGQNNDTKQSIADKGNAAKQTLSDRAAAAKAALQKQRDDNRIYLQTNELYTRDKLATQRDQVTMGIPPAIGAAKQRLFDIQNKQWEDMVGQAHSMETQADQARQVADPATTPDGQPFQHPFLGTTQTMNPTWRAQLQMQADKTEQDATQLHEQAAATAGNLGVKPGIPGGPAKPQGPAVKPQAGAGTPQAPAAKPVSGDPVAHGIATYQIAPPSARSISSGPGKMLMSRVLQENPDYQATQYPIFQSTEKSATSGKMRDQANAGNTAMLHMGNLYDAALALKNNDFPALNRVANAIGVQVGRTPATTYKAIADAVGPELAQAYGQATGGERNEVQSHFSSSLAPQQILDNIAARATLLKGKMDMIQSDYNRGTYNRGKQSLLAQEANAALQKVTKGGGSAIAVGQTVNLKGKGQVTVTAIHPDGSFDYK